MMTIYLIRLLLLGLGTIALAGGIHGAYKERRTYSLDVYVVGIVAAILLVLGLGFVVDWILGA